MHLARGSWEVCRCERDLDMDLERPRVLLSAVHVRRCLCDIVMLSSCALSEGSGGPPFLYTFPMTFPASKRANINERGSYR